MNLNEIMQDFETANREVELTNPKGEPTGWFFELRHESSKKVQRFMTGYRSKLQDVTIKRKTQQQKQLMADHEDGLRAVQVANWRWAEGDDIENGRPPFSKRELLAVLKHEQWGYHIREFIDREVGSLEDFLTRSEDS
jgi:hypothetical protein